MVATKLPGIPAQMPEPEEPKCECENTPVRVRTRSNGVKAYVPQCTKCGREGPARRKDTFTPRQLEALFPFDEELPQQWQERINDYYRQRRQISQVARDMEWNALRPERQRQYQAYLQTPEWAEKRDRVLRREAGICQGCRDNRATHVHHETYLHIFNEFLFELVALCRDCHKRYHGGEEHLAWGDD